MDQGFKFTLRQRVKLDESEERGKVIGRAEYLNTCNKYLVRYVAGDGRQVEAWFDQDAIVAL